MRRVELSAYWSWAHSDLLANAERGRLAEFIVGLALDGLGASRVEWDDWDVLTPDGLKIEVKASGYVQSWAQTKPSTLRFGINESRTWSEESKSRAFAAKRNSDIYVFCIHAEKERTAADPLELGQWEFIVVPTSVLDEKLGAQKSVGIGPLLNLGGQPVSFENLAAEVRKYA